MSALKTQVGGSHYKGCAIQPIEYIEANSLSFIEGCILKRITRHDKPTGKGREDIEKAIHELKLLLELRYAEPGKPVNIVRQLAESCGVQMPQEPSEQIMQNYGGSE